MKKMDPFLCWHKTYKDEEMPNATFILVFVQVSELKSVDTTIYLFKLLLNIRFRDLYVSNYWTL